MQKRPLHLPLPHPLGWLLDARMYLGKFKLSNRTNWRIDDLQNQFKLFKNSSIRPILQFVLSSIHPRTLINGCQDVFMKKQTSESDKLKNWRIVYFINILDNPMIWIEESFGKSPSNINRPNKYRMTICTRKTSV